MRCLFRIAVLGCIAAGLVGVQALPAPVDDAPRVEIRAALSHLAHVRTMAHRLSRQHLHAQIGFDDGQRDAMVRAADEMDALLSMLGEGDVRLSIPPPPTRELREALNGLDSAWAPLRTLAVSSRWEYPRRAGLEGRSIFRDDPLLIEHADELATTLDARALEVIVAYQEYCRQRGLPGCEIDASTQAPAALERLTKQASLLAAGIDADQRREVLRTLRDEFTRMLEASIGSPRARDAMSPARGAAGALTRASAGRIEENGRKLLTQIERLLEDPESADLRAMFETQAQLLYSFQRLASALIIIDTPLAVGGSSSAQHFKHEHVSAQLWLGRLRTLMSQLNKDNLLYRLRIEDANQPRRHARNAADEMEQAFRILREGDPRTGVPRPPNATILQQLAEIEGKWDELSRLLLADPFEYFAYLRSQFPVRAREEPDPLALRHLDARIAALVESVGGVSELYAETCRRDGYSVCQTIGASGEAQWLSEELVKQAILHFVGLPPAGDGIVRTRDALGRFLDSPSERLDLNLIVETGSRPATQRVRTALDDTRNLWSSLRRELEFVLQGSADAENMQRLVDLQRDLTGQLDRLGAAIAVLELLDEAGQQTAAERSSATAEAPTGAGPARETA